MLADDIVAVTDAVGLRRRAAPLGDLRRGLVRTRSASIATNSSPPKRATTSVPHLGGQAARRLDEQLVADGVPNESLTSLEAVGSAKSTATWPREGWSSTKLRGRRRPSRLDEPVSRSRVARGRGKLGLLHSCTTAPVLGGQRRLAGTTDTSSTDDEDGMHRRQAAGGEGDDHPRRWPRRATTYGMRTTRREPLPSWARAKGLRVDPGALARRGTTRSAERRTPGLASGVAWKSASTSSAAQGMIAPNDRTRGAYAVQRAGAEGERQHHAGDHGSTSTQRVRRRRRR